MGKSNKGRCFQRKFIAYFINKRYRASGIPDCMGSFHIRKYYSPHHSTPNALPTSPKSKAKPSLPVTSSLSLDMLLNNPFVPSIPAPNSFIQKEDIINKSDHSIPIASSHVVSSILAPNSLIQNGTTSSVNNLVTNANANQYSRYGTRSKKLQSVVKDNIIQNDFSSSSVNPSHLSSSKKQVVPSSVSVKNLVTNNIQQSSSSRYGTRSKKSPATLEDVIEAMRSDHSHNIKDYCVRLSYDQTEFPIQYVDRITKKSDTMRNMSCFFFSCYVAQIFLYKCNSIQEFLINFQSNNLEKLYKNEVIPLCSDWLSDPSYPANLTMPSVTMVLNVMKTRQPYGKQMELTDPWDGCMSLHDPNSLNYVFDNLTTEEDWCVTICAGFYTFLCGFFRNTKKYIIIDPHRLKCPTIYSSNNNNALLGSYLTLTSHLQHVKDIISEFGMNHPNSKGNFLVQISRLVKPRDYVRVQGLVYDFMHGVAPDKRAQSQLTPVEESAIEPQHNFT